MEDRRKKTGWKGEIEGGIKGVGDGLSRRKEQRGSYKA